jgi:hypothetical protein
MNQRMRCSASLEYYPTKWKPFDRDYFAPWSGALRMAMPRIGKEAQRRHGVK